MMNIYTLIVLSGIVMAGACFSFTTLLWNMNRLESKCESLEQRLAELESQTFDEVGA